RPRRRRRRPADAARDRDVRHRQPRERRIGAGDPVHEPRARPPRDHGARRNRAVPLMRPRATIVVKLLLAYAVPTVALFSLFAWVAYDLERRDLESELGKRLTNIAASAAAQVRGKHLIDADAGQTGWRSIIARRLEPFAVATGARIYVFRP